MILTLNYETLAFLSFQTDPALDAGEERNPLSADNGENIAVFTA